MRDHGIAIAIADHPERPQIGDITTSFVYARLQDAAEDEPAGYPPAALDRWAGIAQEWARGEAADGIARAAAESPHKTGKRDVFVFFINGAKVRAPAAAQALIDRLDRKRGRAA